MWLIFHSIPFIGPLRRFRCQSGSLAQLNLDDISGEGNVSFREAIPHKYSIKLPKQHVILSRMQTKTIVKVSIRYSEQFFIYGLLKLKIPRFSKKLPLASHNFDTAFMSA